MSTQKPTHKPLLGAWELIVDSWTFFTATWNTTIKTSILFLYAGIATFLVALLTRRDIGLIYVNGLLSLAILIFTVWVTIRLTDRVLRLTADKKPQTAAEESKTGTSLFFPYFWVKILVGLITFGGFVLLIIPGIYLTVLLSMSDILVLDQGKRGFQAIAGSRELIRGRWWPTFGRSLAAAVLFGILLTAVMAVLVFLLTQITGPEFFTADPNAYDALPYGVNQFLQMGLLAVFMPLMIGFQVKLYRALAATR